MKKSYHSMVVPIKLAPRTCLTSDVRVVTSLSDVSMITSCPNRKKRSCFIGTFPLPAQSIRFECPFCLNPPGKMLQDGILIRSEKLPEYGHSHLVCRYDASEVTCLRAIRDHS